jgi:ribosome-associated protein
MPVPFTETDMPSPKKSTKSPKPATPRKGAKPARKPAKVAPGKPVRKVGKAKPARPASRPKVARRKAATARAPVAAAPKPAQTFPPALVAAVRALDEKKASDIRVLQLGALSSVADYYILATGTSEPHLRALRIELDRALGDAGSRVRGIEAQRDSGWVVVDAFDLLFHLFRPEVRSAFRLEALWKDGRDIPVGELLAA